MKLKYKLLIVCFALSSLFVSVGIANSLTPHYHVSERAMI
ncbi:PhrC/PhrF family phosphatase-inhibitory pheromone [Bacillus sp. YC2]|nr:PhrC/PhrF family phosphatase-inhibitory pheromone [Bacillus sp. YC2]MBY8911762.1 PhrC/PhrF family phosphatase-inhibitory pheromone [Bacillus sp. YC2]